MPLELSDLRAASDVQIASAFRRDAKDFAFCGAYNAGMSDFTVDVERETDGRWIGEVPELPGVLVYGGSRDEAVAKAKALAFRVLADRLEHGEEIPEIQGVFAVHE
jgi:predicted RNase H-like HicB family nuclease